MMMMDNLKVKSHLPETLGFMLKEIKPPALPPVRKPKRKPISVKNRNVYGFGSLVSDLRPVGGTFYVPQEPQILSVKGSAIICGLDDLRQYVEEDVTDADTQNLFFRVLSVKGDAEVTVGSAIVAKTDQGAWRVPTWSTGDEEAVMESIFLHTRADHAVLQLVFIERGSGKVQLIREFHPDMSQFCVPGMIVIPPDTDVVWMGSCSVNAGWASVSFVINSSYAR